MTYWVWMLWVCRPNTVLIPRKKIFQRDYCSLGPSQLQDVNNQSLVQCYSTNVLVNGNDNETTDDTTIGLLIG